MDFLSSPIHNYSYETFDDAFFELPKEMDFELDNDFRDGLSYSVDESDDLNYGMYGVWNAKHPWTVNNNSSSLYNSNLHLDFIGGDPGSAMMVNPNVVLPNGFNTEEKLEDALVSEEGNTSSPSTHVPEETSASKVDVTDFTDEEDASSQVKRIKSKFIAVKEITANGDCLKSASPKNGIRVLKPTVIESSISPALPNVSNSPQVRNDSNRPKTSVKNFSGASKCGFYYQNETFYPKPAFSYSCLIAMALKNSKHGCLPVAEIYNFMCNHFPYFKTAPNGWKNSVRHNLSLNKCFEKIEKPAGSTQRKGCLWALNPSKAAKLEEEVQKCAKKDVVAIKKAMEYPEHLELLERGELKSLYDTEQSVDEDDEDMDATEEDTEGEEPCAGDDDTVEDQLSEGEEQNAKEETKKTGKYPVLNVSAPPDLPEFKIEVDDSIYEELIGTIKNEQLFTVNGLPSSGVSDSCGNALKKIKKYYIHVNNGSDEKISSKNISESESYDHYDINNFLRLENEMKLTAAGKRTPPRFTKRVVPTSNSRIKPIKFKTWD